MYESDAPETNKSKKWIVIGAVAAIFVVLIIIVAVIAAMSGTRDQSANSPAESTDSGSSVATEEEVQQNMTDLEGRVKDAQSAQSTAKASIDDSKKQIKVGN